MSDKNSGGPTDSQLSKDGRPSPEKQIVLLSPEFVKHSDIYPYDQIKAEVVDSGVFQNGKLEGKGNQIPNIEHLVFRTSGILARSGPQFDIEKLLDPDFDAALTKLSEVRESCLMVGIGGKEADDLLNRLRKLKDTVLNKFASNYRFDIIELLILLLLNRFEIRTSDRALARCIERLLKIPSINNQMITAGAVRKRISKLRKEGKIPEIGG